MFVDERAEDVVHHHLEGRRGVCQSKEHYHWFKDAITRLECHLKLISVTYPYIIVSPSYVESRIDECFCEVCNHLGNKGEWCVVRDGIFVEVSVVLDWA